MKPSDLYNIRRDITELVMFEHWDSLTKELVNYYMKSNKIQYRVSDMLDEHNRLSLWIIDGNREYVITI